MAEVRRQTAAAVASMPQVENGYTRMLAELRALRSSLTPAQLREQARQGYTSLTPPAPIDQLPKLVKLKPDFPWTGGDPSRIRLMEIHFSGQGAPYDAMMEKAITEIDWAALEALMR